MKCYLRPGQVATGQEAMIRDYGQMVWEDICNEQHLDRTFAAGALVGELPSIAHLAPKTQYQIIRAVLLSVEAEWAGDQLNAPLRRISRMFWRLV